MNICAEKPDEFNVNTREGKFSYVLSDLYIPFDPNTDILSYQVRVLPPLFQMSRYSQTHP
jgi:hypothetical protein